MTPTERAAVAEAIAATEKLPGSIVSRVCDLEGYSSPDDQPDLLQCTTGELEACAENSIYPVLASLRAVASAPAESVGPRQPTEEMLNAARDWSYKEYGKPIGSPAAIGCWQSMFDAAPKPSREAIIEAGKQASWKCKAKPNAVVPEDCDWPYCGCDPHAEKIIEALIECGWKAPADQSDAGRDGVIEECAMVAAKFKWSTSQSEKMTAEHISARIRALRGK